MITTKQRASLKALAHPLSPVVIIGKDGITGELLKSIDGVLETRELIKVKILNNCEITTKQAIEVICRELKAEPVQCIGSIVVIYRYSHKKNIEHIEF